MGRGPARARVPIVKAALPIPRGQLRCAQCFQPRARKHFVGAKGGIVGRCDVCRSRCGRWDKMTSAERLAVPRRGVPVAPGLRARLYTKSYNRKLGGIPASVTSRGTCPPSCSFYSVGCFAIYHVLAHHWRQVGAHGDTWPAFVDAVAQLPPGTLWRHNTAGDLPGDGEAIDGLRLSELVMAAEHTRPFTFSHKHHGAANQLLVWWANSKGFTVNLSADSLGEADRLAALCIGPVAVVLPSTTRGRHLRTPDGRQVVVCPAQTDAHLTCATCQLCAKPDRKALIGFLSHGQSKARVDQLVQLRRHA
jgi:hypothetical protein